VQPPVPICVNVAGVEIKVMSHKKMQTENSDVFPIINREKNIQLIWIIHHTWNYWYMRKKKRWKN